MKFVKPALDRRLVHTTSVPPPQLKKIKVANKRRNSPAFALLGTSWNSIIHISKLSRHNDAKVDSNRIPRLSYSVCRCVAIQQRTCLAMSGHTGDSCFIHSTRGFVKWIGSAFSAWQAGKNTQHDFQMEKVMQCLQTSAKKAKPDTANTNKSIVMETKEAGYTFKLDRIGLKAGKRKQVKSDLCRLFLMQSPTGWCGSLI